MSHRSAWVRFGIAAAMLATAALLPASDLDFLRDTPMTYLTDDDRKLQREAALVVLEHERPDWRHEWSNPLTGASGSIEGQGDLVGDDGLRCRKIKIIAAARGAQNVFVFPICKDAHGKWFFGSGLKLRPVQDTGRSAMAFVR